MTARACRVCDPEAKHPFSTDGRLLTHVAICHQRQLCIVCLQSGRCSFPLHLPVYTKKELDLHLAKHPVCRLCNCCFYDTEDMQEHLDVDHEYCYICRENFLGLNALTEHLRWEDDSGPLSAL
ncbi:TPA: hypothetical protein ACH3X2_011850 [Trebouxia sp. C0005]